MSASPSLAPASEASYAVSAIGSVRPPDDIMAVARVELSEEGFARLMTVTNGVAPTPLQLCREVEFERSGAYPPEPLSNERVIAIAREAALIATARVELTDANFKALMHAIGWRGPTAHELVRAVEAQRADPGTNPT